MNITEQASAELKKALVSFNKPGACIHIFSSPGCCGPSVQMDITTKVGTAETILSMQGIDLFVANDLLTTLEDVTIEYNENGFLLAGLKKSGGCCS